MFVCYASWPVQKGRRVVIVTHGISSAGHFFFFFFQIFEDCGEGLGVGTRFWSFPLLQKLGHTTATAVA